MGTATYSPLIMALEIKNFTGSELAGCTRFFRDVYFCHGLLGRPSVMSHIDSRIETS